MNTKEFDEQLELSKIGVAFVMDRFEEVTNLKPSDIEDVADSRIEGKDISTTILCYEEEARIIITGAEWAGIPDGTKAHSVFAKRQGVEVKTQRFNEFIATSRYIQEPHGCLGLPIWKNSYRKSYGSLYEMMFPEAAGNSEEPISIVFVLLDNNERPYATITFKHFKSLVARLAELAKDAFDINDIDAWHQLPLGDQEYNVNGLRMVKNMWLIPFDALSDLAIVTMVGEDPEFQKGGNRCSIAIQRSRLDYLKECSHGNHISQNKGDETPPGFIRYMGSALASIAPVKDD